MNPAKTQKRRRHCLRCGWRWWPRHERPAKCPRCKNPNWRHKTNAVRFTRGQRTELQRAFEAMVPEQVLNFDAVLVRRQVKRWLVVPAIGAPHWCGTAPRAVKVVIDALRADAKRRLK